MNAVADVTITPISVATFIPKEGNKPAKVKDGAGEWYAIWDDKLIPLFTVGADLMGSYTQTTNTTADGRTFVNKTIVDAEPIPAPVQTTPATPIGKTLETGTNGTTPHTSTGLAEGTTNPVTTLPTQKQQIFKALAEGGTLAAMIAKDKSTAEVFDFAEKYVGMATQDVPF